MERLTQYNQSSFSRLYQNSYLYKEDSDLCTNKQGSVLYIKYYIMPVPGIVVLAFNSIHEMMMRAPLYNSYSLNCNGFCFQIYMTLIR